MVVYANEFKTKEKQKLTKELFMWQRQNDKLVLL